MLNKWCIINSTFCIVKNFNVSKENTNNRLKRRRQMGLKVMPEERLVNLLFFIKTKNMNFNEWEMTSNLTLFFKSVNKKI